MKRILSALLSLLALSGAAQVVYKQANVESSGWVLNVTLANEGTNGVFNFGFLTNNSGPSKVVLSVMSPGFDDSGNSIAVTRTIYGTKQLRLPYPNNALNDCIASGSDCVIRLALSDYVFSGDSNITMTAASNWYSNNVPATNAMVVVNNSGLPYPKVLLNWTWPGWQKVTNNTMTLRAVGFHASAQKGRPLRAVKFIAQDQHSNAATNIVLSMSAPDRSLGDAMPLAEYVSSLNINGFTNGDLIRCDMIGYPWWGGVTASTFTSGFSLPKSQLAAQTNLCDRLSAINTVVAVLDVTNGSDTTGRAVNGPLNTVSPPAPFLTLAIAVKAMHNTNLNLNAHNDLSGCTLYVTNGSFNWTDTSGTTASGTNNWAWFTIQAYPGVSSNNVTLTGSGSGISGSCATRLKLSGLSISNTGANYVFSGQTYFWLDRCDYLQGSTAEWGGTTTAYATGNNMEKGNTTGLGFRHFGAEADEWSIVRGNRLLSDQETASSTATFHYYVFVGNTGQPWMAGAGAGISFMDPAIIYNNSWLSITNPNRNILSVAQITNGLAIIQNVFECQSNVAPSILGLMADTSNNGTDSTNVLYWQNTNVGQRNNAFYNDVTTQNPIRTLCYMSGNLSQDLNIKSDTFNSGAARTNNWSEMNMVGSRGNLVEKLVTGSQFYPDFDGLSSWWDLTGTESDFAFINDASFQGSKAGSGNYRVHTRSLATRPQTSGAYLLPYDIEGNARGGFDPPGAYASASPRKGAGFFGQ